MTQVILKDISKNYDFIKENFTKQVDDEYVIPSKTINMIKSVFKIVPSYNIKPTIPEDISNAKNTIFKDDVDYSLFPSKSFSVIDPCTYNKTKTPLTIMSLINDTLYVMYDYIPIGGDSVRTAEGICKQIHNMFPNYSCKSEFLSKDDNLLFKLYKKINKTQCISVNLYIIYCTRTDNTTVIYGSSDSEIITNKFAHAITYFAHVEEIKSDESR